jgi:hypothetical protein
MKGKAMELRKFLKKELKGVPVWIMLLILVMTGSSIIVVASTLLWTHTITWTVTTPTVFTVYGVVGNPFTTSQESSTSPLALTTAISTGATEIVSGNLAVGTYYFYYVCYNPSSTNINFNVEDSSISGATALWKSSAVQSSLPSSLSGFGTVWNPETGQSYQTGYMAMELALTVFASGSYTFSFYSP